MAVIAQADPYQSLIRKIGYSVGLEEMVDRVKKLVSLYVKDRSISPGAFRDLVEKEFGRKNAAEHFANFYSTLNLVRVVGRGSNTKKPLLVGGMERGPKALEPLYQLDSLSILRRLFEAKEHKYNIALKVVLTQCVIEADGDIFLNGLLSDFRPDEMKGLLEAMVQTKRRQLIGMMPGLLSKIYQIVDIKNESKPDSSRQGSAPQGRFGRRTEPLDSSRRTLPLTLGTEGEIKIPADYLDKASKTRKGWARDLGLFDDREKTELGKRLLDSLKKCVISTSTKPPAALFWGYRSDLERIHLKPDKLGLGDFDCEAWDLLCAIADSHRGNAASPRAETSNPDELFAFLRRTYDLYKEGNSSKGLIRNSLPLYVAEPGTSRGGASQRGGNCLNSMTCSKKNIPRTCAGFRR